VKCHAALKKLDVNKIPKNKIVSVNLRPVLISLLDFLTCEAGTDWLSCNIGAVYCVISQKSAELTNDLVTQTLVWLHMD